MALGSQYWQIQPGTTTIIFYAALALMFLGAVAVIVMFLVLQKRYSKFVEIRKKVGGGSIKIDDKCREWTDEQGNKWWVRKDERDALMKLMAQPPSTAIITDKKGREHATAKLIDGHYIWLEDKDNIASIPADLFKPLPDSIANEKDITKKMRLERDWKSKRLNDWKESKGYEVCFHPLTSNQRAIYTNALRRAEERRAKGWQTQLPMIIGLGAVVIILIALLIFYGNIAKPVLEMGDKVIKFQDGQTEQLKIIQSISNDVQILKEEKNSGTPPGG